MAMHWLALQPTLEAPDARLADTPSAWAWWALQFTPQVAYEDGALVLEVSASERLFGGRAALQAQIFAANGPLAGVEYAQGATSLIAIGRLGCICSDEAHDAPPPDSLPLHTLAAARAHVPTLARLGVRTWGQLRALPRGGLARRFGAPLLDALDRAYGQRPETYAWLTVPPVFDVPLELAASVESAPALLFGTSRLLAQLRVWLQARQRGVLALELLWELDARRANAQHVDAHHCGGAQGRLLLRTAQPTQDMQHLQRLLAEQLARVTLPAPVLYLRLRSLQTQALAGESASLLPDDVRQGDSLHQLLERLSARLGAQQVRCATAQADHRPERMQHWQAAASAMHTKAGGPKGAENAALYPTWLLPVPQRLAVQHGSPQYQGPLTLLAGPQRLEAGWLEGDAHCALRDYFVARSAVAGLVWVYRERLAGQGDGWYLHGLFA